MPFYLVTQTLLVEGENEHDAAEKAAARIRSGQKIAVCVKADETTVTHITVAAVVDAPPPIPLSTTAADAQSLCADPEAVVARPTDRKLLLKRFVSEVLLLLRPRA